MRTFPNFQDEVTAIDPRLSVVANSSRPGLANILLDGRDICPVPANEIFDKPDKGYRYTFPNGWEVRHKSREEALGLIQSTLELIKTEEGANQFFGRGDYA